MTLNKHEVGFLVDGSFLPLRNGTNYSIYSLMNSLARVDDISPNLVISYRGWDEPELYQDQNFRTIFLASRDRYNNHTAMDYVLVFHNIRFLHIYNAEEVIELAPRLKNLGIKVIYEAINIDHVLYARLAADNADVSNMKLQQTEAMSLADYVLCRSEIDEHHILEMGISSEKVSVYRGAIDTNNITYQTRTELRHKLVFLGHMYYPPNENALKLLADKVLPKLREIDSRYTITIIGIIAPSIRDEYLKKGILFRGGVDDLSKELLDYDIALCPLFEGSGTRLKVLDFFSSGLPVISTTLGIEGLHPQIQDCVVIEDDINQYAQVIHQLAMNLSSYAKIAQKGREYVESYYDWHNNLEPFLNLYRKS